MPPLLKNLETRNIELSYNMGPLGYPGLQTYAKGDVREIGNHQWTHIGPYLIKWPAMGWNEEPEDALKRWFLYRYSEDAKKQRLIEFLSSYGYVVYDRQKLLESGWELSQIGFWIDGKRIGHAIQELARYGCVALQRENARRLGKEATLCRDQGAGI